MIGMNGLTQVAQKAKYLLDANAHAILTGAGVAGTVGTAYLTGRASFKAAEVIKEQSHLKHVVEPKHPNLPAEIGETHVRLDTMDKVKLVWKFYIPPVAVGTTTITCIIAANRVASKKIAALAIASGISERALQEYKEKVSQRFGEKQATNLRDEIAQDHVSKNPPTGQQVIIASGKVLCYDELTGRYFESTVEDIKKAENKVNREINLYMHSSLSNFYSEVGLPATTYTDMVGWNSDQNCEVSFSTVLTPDSKPCLAIDFVKPPITEYDRLY